MERKAFVTGLVLLAGAASGGAATLCVDPAGGACHSTIQAAVDAASGGDVIQIRPAVYFEQVVVPSGKDGLQIMGVSYDAIVDGSAYFDRGILNDAPGFLIQSAHVRLRGLTLRNGLFGVQLEGEGGVLERLRAVDAGALTVMAPRAVVSHNDLKATWISVFGEEAVVRDNRVVAGAIYLDAVGDADRSRVLRNRVENGAIFADADDLVVRDNEVRYPGFLVGLLGAGDNIVVERNRVSGGQIGIQVACTHDSDPNEIRPAICTHASAADNTAMDTSDYGLIGRATGPGLVIRNNRFARTALGMNLTGPIALVERNHVEDVGRSLDGHCIEAFGAVDRIARNTALRCSNAGIYLNGVSIIEENRIEDTAENGVTVDGDPAGGHVVEGVRVLRNVSRDNAAQGVAIINGAAGTRVSGNVALGNRTDFCDEGVGTVISGNTFGTTGACAVLH